MCLVRGWVHSVKGLGTFSEGFNSWGCLVRGSTIGDV